MTSTHPNAIANFRATTEKRATKMDESVFYRFWCPECDTSQPVSGRKSRGWKMGFRCAKCAESKKVV